MSIHVEADSLIYTVKHDSNVQVRIAIGDAQSGGMDADQDSSPASARRGYSA
ncbi:MAG: hypothetical protein JWP01_3975 [Myxococcales bacterium]|nr:hypothetical protein [Myxococcales bacterium]